MRNTARLVVTTIVFGVTAYGAIAQQTQPYPFSAGTPQDDAEIKAIITDAAKEVSDAGMASNLDWENAFGIRYSDLKKRDAFYQSVVKPLQKDVTADETLEVKIRYIKPEVAVADEYWHIVGQTDQNTGKKGADRWGRSTDIFVKQNGHWTEVQERITDLRSPYYKHLDAMPVAASLPNGALQSLAGDYAASNGMTATAVVDGDHLVLTTPRSKFTMVPQSPSELLSFYGDGSDVSEYMRVAVGKDAGGKTTLTLSGAEVGARPQLTITKK